MFFIQELRRALNVQSVSIRVRFLVLIKFLILILIFNLVFQLASNHFLSLYVLIVRLHF